MDLNCTYSCTIFKGKQIFLLATGKRRFDYNYNSFLAETLKLWNVVVSLHKK